MMKVHHVKIREDELAHYFIAGDFHERELDISCYSIFKQHAKKYTNPRLIINGDFLDAWYLMTKNPLYQRWVGRKDGMDQFFIPNYDQEIRWGNFILNELCKIFESIYFIKGNHEGKRFDEFVSNECPHNYKNCFNVERDLHLEDRGIPWIPYNDYLMVGDVAVTHGQYHSRNALTQQYLSCANSVIQSHLHRLEIASFDSWGEAKFAVSIPAMCHRPNTERMKYMRNKDNRHSTGYGRLSLIGPKCSSIQHYVVKNGALLLEDEVLRASPEIITTKDFSVGQKNGKT